MNYAPDAFARNGESSTRRSLRAFRTATSMAMPCTLVSVDCSLFSSDLRSSLVASGCVLASSLLSSDLRSSLVANKANLPDSHHAPSAAEPMMLPRIANNCPTVSPTVDDAVSVSAARNMPSVCTDPGCSARSRKIPAEYMGGLSVRPPSWDRFEVRP